MKRTLACLLLAALLFALLPGCAGEGTPAGAPSPAGAADWETRYRSAFSPLMDPHILTCCVSGDRLYYVRYDPLGEGADTLRACRLDGGDDGELPAYAPVREAPEDLWFHESALMLLLPAADGNILLLELESYLETMAMESVSRYHIRILDPTGAELSRTRLEGRMREAYMASGVLMTDAAGNLYTHQDGQLLVSGPDGQDVAEVSGGSQDTVPQLLRLADGRVASVAWAMDRENGYMVRPIEPESRSLGAGSFVAQLSCVCYTGAAGFDFLCVAGDTLFGYTLGEDTGTPLLNLLNCGIYNGSVRAFADDPEGEGLFCVSAPLVFAQAEPEPAGIYRLTAREGDAGEERTVLTMACFELDRATARQLLQFNRDSADYRIEVRDYGAWAAAGAYYDGVDRLAYEILQGEVPDIFCTYGLPLDSFARKGLLEDLWPYIDADGALGGREALVSEVYDLMDEDGRLFQIVPAFSITAVAGPRALLGEGPSLSFDEVYAALAQMPEGCTVFEPWLHRNAMIIQSNARLGEDLVDYDAPSCDFEGPAFRALLDFIGLFPEEADFSVHTSDHARIQAGEQLLSLAYIYTLSDLDRCRHAFGGDCGFYGFPGATGSGCALALQGGFAMSAQSAHKEAAWAFMRLSLTEQAQLSSAMGFSGGAALPTNRNALLRLLDEQMTPTYDAAGNETPKYVMDVDGEAVPFYAWTQEQADAFLDLLAQTDRLYAGDAEIVTIIQEESAAYYAGDRSAEDTAAAIQRRAELYLHEGSR